MHTRLFAISMVFVFSLSDRLPAQEYIPAPEAIRQLIRLEQQDVRIVLQGIDGNRKVIHGRVDRIPITADEVHLKLTYFTRPGTGESLIQEYLEADLGRKLTSSDLDQQLITEARSRSRSLIQQDQLVRSSGQAKMVLAIEEIDLTGPPFPVKAFFKPVKLDKATDPFQTDLLDEPSPWVIEYGIQGDPKRFRFRLRNTLIVNRFQQDERVVPIEQITIDPPKWQLMSHQWVRVVPFTRRYAATRKHGANHTVTRYFEIDRDGYLVKLRSAWDDVLDPEYDQRLRLWRQAERDRARQTAGQ